MFGIAMLIAVMGATVACGKEPAASSKTPTHTDESVITDTPTPTQEATPTEEVTPTPTVPVGPVEIPEEALEDIEPIEFFKDVLWVGDSLMTLYQWDGAQYADPKSFGSYKADTWMSRSNYAVRYAIEEEINKHDPKYKGEQVKLWDGIPKTGKTRIIMFFGPNDIAKTGVELFIQNYQTLIERIQATGTYKFYILSITPMRKDMESVLCNALIDEANIALQQFCAEKGYTYVDVATPLKNSEGDLDLKYSDGSNVHLVRAGYAHWDKVLIKLAKEQLYLENYRE